MDLHRCLGRAEHVFEVSDLKVAWRDADGDRHENAVGGVDALDFFEMLPARKIPNRPGRVNKIGFYWSSTTGAHHQFESALEAETMRWLDWRPDVIDIAAQPFRLSGLVDDHRRHNHFPDLLAARSDGSFELIDVKPLSRCRKPAVLRSFAMSEAACAVTGWRFVVSNELSDPFRRNLRFLAQYRRDPGPGSYPVDLVFRALGARRMTASNLAEACGGPAALPTIFHLVWHRVLSMDWDTPLSERTELWLTPSETT